MNLTTKRSAFVFAVAMAASQLSAADKTDLSKVDVSKLPAAASKKGVTYAADIKPLFDASCTRCHGAERPKAELRLDSRDGALKGGKDGKVVMPGDAKKSLLLIAAAQIDEDTAMPPKRGPGRGGPGGNRFQGRPGGAPGGVGGAGGPGQPPSGGAAPGGSGGPGGPGGGQRPGGPGGPGGFGPPAKPLTTEQVSLVRAWIEQGAK
jgi:hypothetical protein